MNIYTLLFAFESELSNYVDAGYLGKSDEPTQQAVIGLLQHINTVRRLPGLDEQPCEELYRANVARATTPDGDSEWDQQD